MPQPTPERRENDELFIRNELDALKDFELKPQAMTVFYDALTKIALLDDPKLVLAVAEEATRNLSMLYSQSFSGEDDLGLFRSLLDHRTLQRSRELKGVPLKVVVPRRTLEFNPSEALEIESMHDRGLLNQAKVVFSGIVGQLEVAPDHQLMDILYFGEQQLNVVYAKSPDIKRDLSKWVYLLNLRFQQVAQQRRKKG